MHLQPSKIIYNNVIGGKKVIKAECLKEGTIIFSFINKGQDDFALFFINHPSKINKNYLQFNNYNSKLTINPDYNQRKITLIFHNIYTTLNQISQSFKDEIEMHMNYTISLYRVNDDDITEPYKYDSLFHFDDDEHKIKPHFEKHALVDPSLNNVTTPLIVDKNKLYYIILKSNSIILNNVCSIFDMI